MIVKYRKIVVISFASVAVLLALSTVHSNLDILEAYAGVTLSDDNVAKTIQIRVTASGTLNEQAYDSFSRVGFVSGEGNFLLESVPSKDKRPFYELLKKSIEDKIGSKDTRMDVAIDLYSGDGELIQSLEYTDCSVTEYFVHGVDSKGKIFFLEEDGTIEIREVTKFSCVSFTLNFDPYTAKTTTKIDEIIEKIKRSEFEYSGSSPFFSSAPTGSSEGDLFYNSMTNTLQRYVNGTWLDISGVGGPPSPRR